MRKPPPRPVLCGEVLIDHFPDGRSVLGGAPFNVAWHLQAFGLSPLLIARIGADREGDRIRQAMQNWGMDTSGLQIDPDRPTGGVQVTLTGGEPAFQILPDRAWDRLAADALPALDDAGLLYTGTLARRSPTTAGALDALQRQGLPLFLDVNLRTPWWSSEGVQQAMDQARWIKLNDDELHRLCPGPQPLARRAEALRSRSGAAAVLVTRGRLGAVLHHDRGRPLRVTPEGDVPVADTVGAGDAFASVIIAGLLLDWPPAISLARAQTFASAIVGQRGAITESRAFYRPFLSAWSLGDD